MIRSDQSAKIFNTFMAGETINKFIPNAAKSELVANPQYDWLVADQAEYETLYRNIGYNVIDMNGAFYLQKIDGEEFTDQAMEIQILLEALAIGMVKNSIPRTRFTEYSSGLPEALMEFCEHDEEILDLLAFCNIKDNLASNIKNKLIARKMAFENAHGRLVLSDSGKAVFDAIFDM